MAEPDEEPTARSETPDVTGQHAAAAPPLVRRAFGWLHRKEVLAGVVIAVLGALAYSVSGASWHFVSSLLHRQPPFQVAVETNQDRIQDHGKPIHGQYVIPRLRADLKTPPPSTAHSCRVSDAWATSQGGVVADTMIVNVVITRSSKVPWTLDSVVVNPIRQRRPLPGTLPSCGRGGGPSDVPVLYVDLYRHQRPSWSFKDAQGHEQDFSYETKVAKFRVVARAHDCDCSWDLHIPTSHGTSGGGPHDDIVVDDHDRPFRTTSTQNATDVYAAGGTWKEVPSAPNAQTATLPPGISLPGFDACNLVDAT